jgi:hypothetical protein
MTLRGDGSKLLLSYGGESDGELERWHYDTFRVVWKNRLLGKPMVTFVVDGTQKVASMKLENIGEFVRVPVKGSTKADTTSKVPDGDR